MGVVRLLTGQGEVTSLNGLPRGRQGRFPLFQRLLRCLLALQRRGEVLDRAEWADVGGALYHTGRLALPHLGDEVAQ